MDRFFQNCQKLNFSIAGETLYLIGITSMFIAAKYEDISPLSITLIERDLGKNTFT